MNVRSAYYFLICSLGLIISVTAKSVDHHSRTQRQSSSEVRPTVETPAQLDLEMYLEILIEREKHLRAANEALLQNAEYSLIKIPAFMLKAALDGYLAARMVGAPTVAAGATRGAVAGAGKAVSAKIASWLKSGGLEKLKSLGFNVGILGINMIGNSTVQDGYHWQYAVPIYGSAYSAYLWSDNLMHTPELIEKNGNEILAIQKEKFRVRALLEKSRD